ncbi:MAG: hypothetical protein ABMA15_22390 [Vicinamibacterales bacterium]
MLSDIGGLCAGADTGEAQHDAPALTQSRRWSVRTVAVFQDAATPRLAHQVRRMLDRPDYRDAAGRLRSEYARVDGPGLAADNIPKAIA